MFTKVPILFLNFHLKLLFWQHTQSLIYFTCIVYKAVDNREEQVTITNRKFGVTEMSQEI